MGNAAVVQLPGYLGKVKVVKPDEFFDPFYFMPDDELFDGNSLHLREQIGEVSIVKIQFFAQVFGKVYLQWVCIGKMHHLDNYIFYFFHQDAFLVIHYL